MNHKLRAMAKRLLWRDLCVHHAPRMVTTLTNGGGGGWEALGKLMFYYGGYEHSTRHFVVTRLTAGHFVKTSRFSKMSGRSFLSRVCQEDLLYVSDPCEHLMREREDDLGVYRGVFKGFMRSRMKECLIWWQVRLSERVQCPYCGARVWSMKAARMVPTSVVQRLGSLDGGLEFFICVNGHLHGTCWLMPLSSDEEANLETEDDEDEEGRVLNK